MSQHELDRFFTCADCRETVEIVPNRNVTEDGAEVCEPCLRKREDAEAIAWSTDSKRKRVQAAVTALGEILSRVGLSVEDATGETDSDRAVALEDLVTWIRRRM